MSIVEFLSQPLWQRLGLTLVHFLWQGLAVAVLVGVLVRVFRLKDGNARYTAYLLAFIAMIVCPVLTFTAIDIPISPNTGLVTAAEFAEVVDSSSYTALSAGDILPEAETSSPAIPTLANSIPLGQRISGWLNVSMPWVLVMWMAGVIVLSVRLLMGFVGVYRWRHHLQPLPERLAQRVASLSNGLGMRQFSRVFISPTVLQAMAVGYLRPMVLLPAAMVAQMQPEMLEAVIAHELAHIRRFDLWINLAQRVTETLLFYHPAVWWLSICLRSERELCCDELAVKATGRRLTYATTLESVGRARFMAKQPVLAAGLGQDNKPTLGRVRHILGLAPAQRNCPFWLAGVIAVLFLAALVIPTTLALTNQSDEKLDFSNYPAWPVKLISAEKKDDESSYHWMISRNVPSRFHLGWFKGYLNDYLDYEGLASSAESDLPVDLKLNIQKEDGYFRIIQEYREGDKGKWIRNEDKIELPEGCVLNETHLSDDIFVTNARNQTLWSGRVVYVHKGGTQLRFEMWVVTKALRDEESENSFRPPFEVLPIPSRYPFFITGRVTDQAGKPVYGASVRVATGMGNLHRGGGQTVTDDKGYYKLRFGPGLAMMIDDTRPLGVGVQAASVRVDKDGFYEQDLCQQGRLVMTDSEEQAIYDRWRERSKGVVLPNKPYELDFVMIPAATIKGRWVDQDNKPVSNRKLWLSGDELYPSTNVLRSIETNQNGEFLVKNIPLKSFWFEITHPRNKREELQTESFTVGEPGEHTITLQYDTSLPGKRVFKLISFEKPAVEAEGGIGWGDVVEGIRANRAKFECGYLAWNSKQLTTRFADSGRPATDLAGEYEVWWDGKKMATKYVRDEVHKDPEGNFSVEKRQGGNSYDGGVLSRKPDFRDGNWLGPQITRWRGLGSQDWLIRQDSKQEGISKDWSVVETNGVKLIRFTVKNMNETDRDYGGYSIRDYDPSKGYGLVNEEWYNPNGSPRLKHTVKILEVIPGGWFPVEVDFKSFAITDGKVYSHNHYALDIERCRFNEKSALPARVFKGAIDKQLKYQEKLQKYLAMELRGLSDVKEAGKADKVKLGAREAIEKLVAAALAGDLEKAGEYAHPDRLPANQIADITEIAKGQNLWIMAVVADDFSAVAVSSVIQGDHDRIGPLVFFLDRVALDGRDNWWVHDIDMETPDGAEVELKRFLEKHPKAQKVPYENKPAVQVESEQINIETLLAKVRQAQRPADTMRVEWGYETMAFPPGAPLWRIKDDGNTENDYVLWKHDYTAIISGRHSRFEDSTKVYQKIEDNKPFYSRQTISVFDSSELRELTEVIKDGNSTYTGRRSPRDDNERKLLILLHGIPSDMDSIVNYEKLTEEFELKLISTDTLGLYILDAVRKEDGIHWQLTIDANRGFNNVKTVLFRPNNVPGIQREINISLRNYSNGIWYPSGVEKIQYSLENKISRKTNRKIAAEFGIDIPENTFNVDFPAGTKVFDVFKRGWITISDDGKDDHK